MDCCHKIDKVNIAVQRQQHNRYTQLQETEKKIEN